MLAAQTRIPVIDIAFREKRTYIQSASLFDFLVGVTGADRNVTLIFRRKIGCEIEALPASEAGDVEAYPARFAGEGSRGKVDLMIAEKLPLTPIQRRESYDEAAVVADSSIHGLTIRSSNGNGATPIDRIVALNKRLIAQTVAPQKVLIFSKVFLRSVPVPTAAIELSLKSRLGVTLFRSAIRADGREIGEIVFYGT